MMKKKVLMGEIEDKIEPLVHQLVEKLLDVTGQRAGRYAVVISPVVDRNGTLYDWSWYWNPETD